MIPKDFQEATAQRIVEIYKSGKQNRVLLADEVGLGKTIVASAVVQKVAEWHRGFDEHFKVIYICSNINIANQNCRKLGIPAEDCLNFSEGRLSMQHLRLAETSGKDHSYMQLIPMTPATSVAARGSGTKEERALIFAVLREYECFKNYEQELSELLMVERQLKWWDWYKDAYIQRIKQAEENCPGYLSGLLSDIGVYFSNHQELYNELLNALCAAGDRFGCRNLVEQLRRMFAQISLDRLEPDLVIMDEFQRFKELISAGGEQNMLKEKFLDQPDIKVLLLSATPYKPYATLEDIQYDDGDSNKEFMEVVSFLLGEHGSHDFKIVWDKYYHALAEISGENITLLQTTKNAAESRMYQCICRTERLRGDVFDSKKACELSMKELSAADITSYTELQKLTTELAVGGFPVEYVKSSPYLLSFMDYKIKTKIERALQESGDYTRVEQSETMLLRRNRINRYYKIPPNNGRLNRLLTEVFGKNGNGSELMLWLPSSRPYYKTNNVFSKNAGYSKTLVFSCWEMVPRMIACMISYEAERSVVEKLGRDDIRYFANEDFDDQKKKKRTVNVRLRDEMADLLLYPCKTLADLYDPVKNIGRKLSDIRAELSKRISELVSDIQARYELKPCRKSAEQILELLKVLDGNDASNLEGIPEKSIALLTDIAIAAPAVCALRLHASTELIDKLAKKFVALFNKQESVYALDAMYKADDPYYEKVVRYCADGNLMSVLEEYLYTLGGDISQMLNGFCDTASAAVETKESFLKGRPRSRLRTHFAVGYYNAKTDNEAIQRTENIRNAFNSPFRPFVLATTSIGQEGLDFHVYARKIMHWNLPSNPIDLEQREGRINRFMCHAIRQNLAASQYGEPPFNKNVWKEIMERASELKGDNSDMVPFWCLPKDYDCRYRIERIVPMYPYSSDVTKYQRLIDVLSVYRLTLGQPNQEDLIDAIKRADIDEKSIEELYMNLSPWSRNNSTN